MFNKNFFKSLSGFVLIVILAFGILVSLNFYEYLFGGETKAAVGEQIK
jgi:hypothetical protein